MISVKILLGHFYPNLAFMDRFRFYGAPAPAFQSPGQYVYTQNFGSMPKLKACL